MFIHDDTYFIVRNNMVILTSPRHPSDNPYIPPMQSLENLKDCKPKGYLSWKAQKKMRNMLELWFNSVYHKNVECKKTGKKFDNYMVFLTLTLSAKQMHDDKEIKRYMLEPYIQELQERYKITNYIWKAEKQHNGNIHFHLILDKFIKYNNLRTIWNKYQKNNGYIQKYQEKRMRNYKNELRVLKYLEQNKKIDSQRNRIKLIKKSIELNEKLTSNKKNNLLKFIKHLQSKKKNALPATIKKRILLDNENNFENPNSTDIGNIKGVKNIIGYIVKEMSKSGRPEREHREIIKELKELYNEPEEINKLKEKLKIIEKKLISGRVYGRSDKLTMLYNYTNGLTGNIKDTLNLILKKGLGKYVEDDFFDLYIFPVWKVFKQLSSNLYNELHKHYLSMYDDVYMSDDDIETLKEIQNIPVGPANRLILPN